MKFKRNGYYFGSDGFAKKINRLPRKLKKAIKKNTIYIEMELKFPRADYLLCGDENGIIHLKLK